MTRYSADIHVVVFDAIPLLAEGVCSLLNSAGGYHARAGRMLNGTVADLRDDLPVDIVLIDPVQFNQDSDDIMRQLAPVRKDAALIGYCAEASVDVARQFLAVGFRGFLAKSVQFATLRAALDVVSEGGVYLDAAFAPALLGPAPRMAAQNIGKKVLSDREYVVLKSVALGMSSKEIGSAMDLSSKTVETYKARASSKLKLQSRREIVDFAIRNGWVRTAV
jgi:two-component system, NarL family, nitrate/nitrite response regulator NarL